MRIFASERVSNLMQKLGMEEGEAIEHPWVTKAIENAQRKVEGHNFDMRKNLLEYDDVANDQRKVVYEQRNMLMETTDMREFVEELREEIISGVVSRFIPTGTLPEVWDLDSLQETLKNMTRDEFDIKAWLEADPNIPEVDILNRILEALKTRYDEKEELAGSEGLRNFERYVSLQALDDCWKEHLAGMDYLRQSVSLRGYAQKNPKQEYKREAFELFTGMLEEYKSQVVTVLSKVQVKNPENVAEAQVARPQPTQVSYEHKAVDSPLSSASSAEAEVEQKDAIPNQPIRRDMPKVGRNEPCPCGSGKKFKACHGRLA